MRELMNQYGSEFYVREFRRTMVSVNLSRHRRCAKNFRMLMQLFDAACSIAEIAHAKNNLY